MDDYTLKPCPWCGSPVRVIEFLGGYAVCCERYGCDRETIHFYKTGSEAIEAWQRGQSDD